MKKFFLTNIGIGIVLLFSFCAKEEKVNPNPNPPGVTAENALESYLNNNDQTFSWELRESFQLANVEIYDLSLVSQEWRGKKWVHQLTIMVPPEVSYDGALLLVTGGRVRNGQPDWQSFDEESILYSSLVSLKNKAITAILWQTPNQPLYNNLYEDALISYTLHQFKSDGDLTWPLLFPMVKSAVRAMDAMQEFGEESLNLTLNRFLISGASKRGWTTWLTGAMDERVAAIAPMVIDVLNMPVNLEYQLEVWPDYSPQIQDYVNLGIIQDISSKEGVEISQMIDPYSYRARLDMPKLIVIGTNDAYWPVDAIKHYYDELPGENYIHYVANAGHDLGGGEQALRAISAFFGHTLKKEKYPDLHWDLFFNDQEIRLSVDASADQLEGAFIWIADSEDRDFRNAKFIQKDLNVKNAANLETIVEYPVSGFRAFYIDLLYTDPNGGNYTKSTRMFVADSGKVFVN